MEKCIRRASARLSYEDLGAREIAPGGDQASGFAYAYNANGEISMQAESYVLRHRDTLYYFHLYTRREFALESSKTWEEIIGSAEWK